ncbi:MAG: hypothetical protein ACI9R3_006531 [Verrucomicrobiales bacterium]|jgi:hypothetical protein
MNEGSPTPVPAEPGSEPAAEGELPEFPVPSAPLADSHLRGQISWADYMDETDWQLQRYLEKYDDPSERLARKSLSRFRL